ncbi:hypothetical protein [Desulfofundulus thermosubterraneus]|uniref:hypothetical protein n=1 Tax=Desulfofundulus thermosubterraneus TaxID=348840 RepID=UPI00093365F2|nr:hypothetical protein [Desulfofundulus thermosubterraneus]
MFRVRLAWRAFLCVVSHSASVLLVEFFLSCAADLVMVGVRGSVPPPAVMLFPFAVIPATLFAVFLACCFSPRVAVKYRLGYFEAKESVLDFTKP